MSKTLKWLAIVVVSLPLLWILIEIIAIPFIRPAIAAYFCPACYDLRLISKHVYVHKDVPLEERNKFLEILARSKKSVDDYFEKTTHMPTILVCHTDECDKKLGGKGARGLAYHYFFIHISPKGINETIVAHELTHVELHKKLGIWRKYNGDFPAWFDEGLAVIVSNDTRYISETGIGKERCLTNNTPKVPLPDRWSWGRVAGQQYREKLPHEKGIYAQAACSVLHWLDANGGKKSLLRILDEVVAGKRSLL